VNNDTDDANAKVIPAHELESRAAIRKRDQRTKPKAKVKTVVKLRLRKRKKADPKSKAKLKLKTRQWEPGDTPPAPPPGKRLTFSGIPNYVLKSRAYRGLSSAARDLLMFTRFQFNGFNNGKLVLTQSQLEKEWGWKHSKKTRSKALKDLLEMGLLHEAREQECRRCGLYALDWEINKESDA
jgi:hypothetical protein